MIRKTTVVALLLLGVATPAVCHGSEHAPPDPKGTVAVQSLVAAVARRRSRLFNRSVLAVLALLFLAHIVVIVSY